jgi:hypothetical protein
MNVGERFGWDTVPFILVAWYLILAASAVWLNRITFQNTNTLLPFLAAVVIIGLVVAKAGFHDARSTFRSHVRVFPDAKRHEGWVLDSDLSIQVGVGLPVHLFSLQHWLQVGVLATPVCWHALFRGGSRLS